KTVRTQTWTKRLACSAKPCRSTSKSSIPSRRTSSSAGAEPDSGHSAFSRESTPQPVDQRGALRRFAMTFGSGGLRLSTQSTGLSPDLSTTSGRKSGPKSRPPRWVEKLFEGHQPFFQATPCHVAQDRNTG